MVTRQRSIASLATDVVQPRLSPVLLLTVDAHGCVLPSLELLAALRLKHGAAIELRPPRQRNGGNWYLDTRPEARRRLTHTRHSRPRFNCDYRLSPRHFRAGPGLLYSRLALVYDPQQPTPTPGYFELTPSPRHSTPVHVPLPTTE
jgi:hypothetical protein